MKLFHVQYLVKLNKLTRQIIFSYFNLSNRMYIIYPNVCEQVQMEILSRHILEGVPRDRHSVYYYAT